MRLLRTAAIFTLLRFMVGFFIVNSAVNVTGQFSSQGLAAYKLSLPTISQKMSRMSPDSIRGLRGPNGRGRDVGFDNMSRRRRSNSPVVSDFQNTIPTWTGSFNAQGLEFKYRMVGTDPKLGSQTTEIPTEIIPLRFVFPDGSIYDSSTDIVDQGQTAIQRIVNSPIFQNYDYVIGGTHIGNTQFGDAYQRANFWDSVSTRSPDYHVLLGQPTVLPTQTVIVPPDKDLSYTDPTGNVRRRVDEDFLLDTQELIIIQLGVSTRSLPIVVWGGVSTQYALAIHPATSTPNGPLPYIGTSYYGSDNGFFNFGGDVHGLSHEIVEWMDDPFAIGKSNYTPGWNHALDDPTSRCYSSPYDLLEVADPIEYYPESSIPLSTQFGNYHVTDAVFLDFFTRASKSRSVNSQYDLFGITQAGKAVGIAPQCVGNLHPTKQIIEVPNSIATIANGLNNKGDVVGKYAGSSGFFHGFELSKGRFIPIDVPGAIATSAVKINEAGVIVGYFYDANINLHGFLYKNGSFQQIDFPGSFDTVAFGINSRGDIVGSYNETQPAAHGFILHNGHFQSFDSPYGSISYLNGINDLGDLAGSSVTNVGQTGFIFGRNGFTEEIMAGAVATDPFSINNSGMRVGDFIDATYFYTNGFINLFGYQHEISFIEDSGFVWNDDVNDINDLNQIVGTTGQFNDPSDPNSSKIVGFVSTLPTAKVR